MECETFFSPNVLETLVVGVVSALIAGFFTISAVFITFRRQEKRDKGRRQEIIRGVLKAICEELNTIYYQLNSSKIEDAWKKFENGTEQFFWCNFPVPQDYLIIYRSNANLIGQIEKPSYLQCEIVNNYMLLQSLMERYKTNNIFLSQYEEAGDEEKTELFSSRLKEIAPILQKEHNSFKESAKNLFKTLKEEYNIQSPIDYGT